MRRQLPRAPTPVPDLQPARYNLSPANNSRSYNLHRRSTASARTNAFNQNHLRTIGDLPNFNLWFGRSYNIARQQKEAALRPALPTSHYRRLARLQFMAGQVVWYCAAASGTGTAGSACRLRTIGDLPGSNLWPGRSCGIARQQVEPAQPAQIRRFFSLHLRLECYIMELDTNINGGTYYAGTETAHGLEHLEHFWQGH